MKKLSLFLAAFALVGSLSAQTIFNGYAYVSDTTAGTGSTWYNMSGSAQANSLNLADLGNFSTNLWLGGQTGFWSNGEGVASVTMNYSITGDATASGSVSYGFQSYSAPDDQWGTDINGANGSDLSVDLIAAHSLAAGDYNIAVWTVGVTNSVNSAFDSNGGGNYNATFTVVPEPGTYALIAGIFGMCYIGLRRRS